MVQTERTPESPKGEMIFRMKQFAIRQEQSALKVGTDGVLLGAYVGSCYPNAERVLDVGTGTGVVALMLAQNMPDARIDAIEIDPGSAQEAERNVSESPFGTQVKVYQGNFTDHTLDSSLYDLIVSNPPYFTGTHSTADARMTIAKHIGELTPYSFFETSDRLLLPHGHIAIITATSGLGAFMSSAELFGFEVEEIVYVQTIPGKNPKRAMVIYRRVSTDYTTTMVSFLTIQKSGQRHDYSEEYRTLLRPFLTIFS